VRLSEETTKFYLAQIVLALVHLHSHNIVYRDVKTENILIDEHGYLKLADFGLSQLDIEGPHDAKSLCGTIYYLAPEVLRKEKYGKNIDCWSLGNEFIKLGILMFEMMTGNPPFYDEKDQNTLFSILNDEVEYPQNFSNSAISLLTGLLVKDPSKRMTSLEAKNHEFFTGINWEILIRKEYNPPYIPSKQIEGHSTIPELSQFQSDGTSNSYRNFDGMVLLTQGFSYNFEAPTQAPSK